MTPKARRIVFLAAIVIGGQPIPAHAGPVWLAVHPLTVILRIGQPGTQQSIPTTRKDVDQLLAEARQAIADNDFTKAESLLARAEKSKIRYTIFHRDSPKRVRRDLEKARGDKKYPQLPSQSSSPPSESSSEVDDLLTDAASAARAAQPDPDLLLNSAASASAPGGRNNGPEDEIIDRVADSIHLPKSNTAAGQTAAGASVDPSGDRPPGTLPLPTAPSTLSAAILRLAAETGSSTGSGDDPLDIQDVASSPDAKSETSNPAAGPASVSQPPERLPQVDATAPHGAADSLIDSTAQQQQVLARKVSSDVLGRLAEARSLLEKDKQPKNALEILAEVRETVAGSGVEPDTRAMLLRRIDRSIDEVEAYIKQHRGEIELDERNRKILAEVERRRSVKVEVGQKLAELVEQFNQLRDEQRFEEMEVVARRARELAPDEPIVQQLWREARFIRRIMNNEELSDRKENGVFQSLYAVEEAAAPPEDDEPFKLPEAKLWQQLSESRTRRQREQGAIRSPRDTEIHEKLKTPVMLRYTETPLSEVILQLMRLSDVNIHLDERGLAEEAVTSDTPVTINLNQEISLKSALNLILEPLHLSYVIKDEVLKITSEHLREGEVLNRTYDVADLVIPIPNFVPGSHFGLQGAINDAHAALGYGRPGGGVNGSLGVLAGGTAESGEGTVSPQLLAQVPGMPGTLTGPGPASGAPATFGPGGLGGGVEPDFDSLIELITTTIEPDTWDDVGGPGSIAPFETTLSLVVSQTQDVHDQIVDLLEQLRRLQDLQVTIEVRFITLSDDFFERIGVDFDFNLVDNYTVDTQNRPVRPSATVGLQATNPPVFTADLDIPFSQGSFGATTIPIGGFDAGSAANFGFAILSDIEAFFFVQAAQGDARSNVLQAPKVTLFNGQTAFVSDTAQSPFVISVIPVVGDFAAAQQPVIVVLSEGTSMSVQAVVSPDRRYVRLTVVPFFSQIGDVDTFTFEGSSSTEKSSSSTTDEDDDSVVDESEDSVETRQGTTVQLPTFAFTTVTTTVSVPDGGTVLLGGIKRLVEGRSEFGVPLLSKIPYVSRLFRNVGIGRETETFMMMVTPRIIIQEEEEERLLGAELE